MNPKYPDIEVQLNGEDNNGVHILGKVRKALRHSKVPESEIKEFTREAMSGDYDHLLQTCMKWVEVS